MIKLQTIAKKEYILTQFKFLQFLKEKSKEWSPPGFQGLSLFIVLKRFARGFTVPNLTERAAAISYNFIMAIPPICLFLFTLVPNLPFISKGVLKKELHSLIYNIIPSPVYHDSIIRFIDSLIDGSKIGLISFTFVLSLFFASNAVIGLMRSFNKNYIGFRQVKGLKRRWDAIKLTLMLFGLLLVYLLLILLQNNILDLLGITDAWTQQLIFFGKWILIVALLFYNYAFIYRYAPSTTKRWKMVSPGAVIGTVLSILVTLGFSAFVSNFANYNLLYGSIGSIMVIMVMVFLNSMAILIGFEFNLIIHTIKRREEKRLEREMNQLTVTDAGTSV